MFTMKKTLSQKLAILKATDVLKKQAIEDAQSLNKVKGGTVFGDAPVTIPPKKP